MNIDEKNLNASLLQLCQVEIQEIVGSKSQNRQPAQGVVSEAMVMGRTVRYLRPAIAAMKDAIDEEVNVATVLVDRGEDEGVEKCARLWLERHFHATMSANDIRIESPCAADDKALRFYVTSANEEGSFQKPNLRSAYRFLRITWKYPEGENILQKIRALAPSQEEICPITLEKLSDLEKQGLLVSIDCPDHHKFSRPAIEKWLESHTTCPVCLVEIKPKEKPPQAPHKPIEKAPELPRVPAIDEAPRLFWTSEAQLTNQMVGQVNCPHHHQFKLGEIQAWMKGHPTCPACQEPINFIFTIDTHRSYHC